MSSELIAVSARTDPLRLQGSLTPKEAVTRLRAVNDWFEAIDLVLLEARARPRQRTDADPTRHTRRAPPCERRSSARPHGTVADAIHETPLGLGRPAFRFDVHGI